MIKSIDKKRKPACAGGEKGKAVLAWFRKHPSGATIKQVAEAVGCAPGRVYEVVRATGTTSWPSGKGARLPAAGGGGRSAPSTEAAEAVDPGAPGRAPAAS